MYSCIFIPHYQKSNLHCDTFVINQNFTYIVRLCSMGFHISYLEMILQLQFYVT